MNSIFFRVVICKENVGDLLEFIIQFTIHSYYYKVGKIYDRLIFLDLGVKESQLKYKPVNGVGLYVNDKRCESFLN